MTTIFTSIKRIWFSYIWVGQLVQDKPVSRTGNDSAIVKYHTSIAIALPAALIWIVYFYLIILKGSTILNTNANLDVWRENYCTKNNWILTWQEDRENLLLDNSTHDEFHKVFNERGATGFQTENTTNHQDGNICPSNHTFPRWYLSLIMFFGALIGGATSEAAGAIAFPIMTLILHMTPLVSRDFSLMSQSVGMPAACFTLIYMRVKLVQTHVILTASVAGIIGVIIGMEYISGLTHDRTVLGVPLLYYVIIGSKLQKFGKNLVCLGQIWHTSKLINKDCNVRFVEENVHTCSREPLASRQSQSQSCSIQESASQNIKSARLKSEPQDLIIYEKIPSWDDSNFLKITAFNFQKNFIINWRTLVILLAGFIGGIFTALTGNGMDITFFPVLTLLFKVNEKTVAPTTIVLMAINTISGFVYRSFWQNGIDGEAWRFLAVTAPIVVAASPFGSFIGSHLSRECLFALIFIFDLIQALGVLLIIKPWNIDKCLVLVSSCWFLLSFALFCFLSYMGLEISRKIITKGKDKGLKYAGSARIRQLDANESSYIENVHLMQNNSISVPGVEDIETVFNDREIDTSREVATTHTQNFKDNPKRRKKKGSAGSVTMFHNLK